jgi:hypothetical protein
MYTPAVEEIPEVILAYGTTVAHPIDTLDLDKRVRAMREIFEAPRTNLPHARKQAARLRDKCIAKGRGDLAFELQTMIDDPVYEERQKAAKEAIAAAKAKVEETKKAFTRELGKLGYLPFVGRQAE